MWKALSWSFMDGYKWIKMLLKHIKRVLLTGSLMTWKCLLSRYYILGFVAVSMMLLLYQATQVELKRRRDIIIQAEEMKYLHNIVEWPSRQTLKCSGNFTGYANKFFRMKSVYYDTKEDMFMLACKTDKLPPEYIILENDYGVGKYLHRIGQMTHTPSTGSVERKHGVTIIVDRCNPHNYFHAMQEWYNLFIIAKLFNYNFKNMQIFIIDSSPKLHLDAHWSLIFPNTTRALNSSNRYVMFDDVLFNIAGCGSPWGYRDYVGNVIPYAEEFSRTFLSSVQLKSNKVLNCQRLTITLYTRRDYFFHPNVHFLQKRNTQRKFKNEDELLQTLQTTYRGHKIQLLVAEDLSPMETFHLAVDTDVLVGMHGCGFTNAMFMPKHGGIFEMYPIFWDIKDFFKDIAISRGIKYLFWRNDRKENEFHDHRTYIPPSVLIQNVDKLIHTIGCV